MDKEMIFFSYSRADSAFVLKLANDLRKAGVSIWLDQLDIKAGSHWDASIEKALNGASRLMIILSPASVASNNVMDEVSYALENNKLVIPVLIQECQVPFRLRRLQRVEFIGDYETEFKQLMEVLGYTVVNTKPAALQQQVPDKQGSVQNEDKEEQITDKETEGKPNSMVSKEKRVDDYAGKDAAMQKTAGELAGRREQALKGTAAQPTNQYRKFLFAGAGLIIIAITVIWYVLSQRSPDVAGTKKISDTLASNETVKTDTANKIPISTTTIKDSNTVKNIVKPIPDTAKPAGANIATALLKAGQKYQGGIIYYLDKTGKHGLIAAASDQIRVGRGANPPWSVIKEYTYDHHFSMNGYNDWRIPTKEELLKLYKAKRLVGGFTDELGYRSATKYHDPRNSYDYFWAVYFSNGALNPQFNYSEGGGDVFALRLVRSF